MEIAVTGRHSGKCAFVDSSVRFLAKELKIDKRKFNITVQIRRGVLKEMGASGLAYKESDTDFFVILDSGLDTNAVIRTLSHEMVHVKQFVRKQYHSEVKRGKKLHYWYGKRYSYDNYYEAPWEIDAATKEGLLAFKLAGAWEKLVGNLEKYI